MAYCYRVTTRWASSPRQFTESFKDRADQLQGKREAPAPLHTSPCPYTSGATSCIPFGLVLWRDEKSTHQGKREAPSPLHTSPCPYASGATLYIPFRLVLGEDAMWGGL